jgi:hypothetical protein
MPNQEIEATTLMHHHAYALFMTCFKWKKKEG